MRFSVVTDVGAPIGEVFPVFGEADFVESLAPAALGLRVLSIGLSEGDEIHARFEGIVRADWISRIVFLDAGPERIVMIDRSRVLPRPMIQWTHTHLLEQAGGGTRITDTVDFEASPGLLTPVLWPLLKVSFLYRRGPYQARFGGPTTGPGP